MMSKRIVPIIFLLLIATFSFAESTFQVVRSSSEGIEIKFEMPNYQVKTTVDGYDKLIVDTEVWTIEPGKPELPVFTGVIAVPETGAFNSNVNIQRTEILNDLKIVPYRENSELELIEDNSVYSKSELYPTSPLSLSDPAIMRGQRLLSFSYAPFRYNPANRELEVTKEAVIQLSFNTSEIGINEVTRSRSSVNSSFVNMWQRMVINPDDIRIRPEFDQPVLAYITPSAAVNDLQPLVDWKFQMGYDVVVATLEETGSNTNDIQDWIADAYNNWANPVDFVCIVGDASGTFSVPAIGNGDHGYALIEGNDELNDVFIGRLSAENSAQLQVIVNKQLLYEKTPFTGTNWFESAALAADTSPSGISTISTSNYIKEIMDDYNSDFTFTELYGDPNPNGMDQAINAGVGYFNYRGYLGMSGWSSSNADGLNNGPKLPVFVIITCGTGGFTGGTSRTEAIIRAGTVQTPKAGVAAIGAATASTHTAFNNCCDGGIFEGLFVEDMRTMGEAIARGRANLYYNYGASNAGQAAFFAEIINLMGDPSLQVWKSEPGNLAVSAPNAVAPNADAMFVEVTDGNGSPVENAWVCVVGANDYQSVVYSDVNGFAYLNLDSSVETGSLTLTVSKPDFIANQSTIQYQANANGVDLVSLSVNTGTALEAGITSTITFEIENIGANGLNNPEANIDGLGFTNITGTSIIPGTFLAGTTQSASFDINLDNTSFPEESIEIFCTISADEGSWSFRELIEVDSPLPIVTDIVVIATNQDYMFLGQTEDVQLSITNQGDIDLSNFDLIVNSYDFRITSNSPIQNIPSLAAGATTNVTVNLTAEMNMVSGSMIPLSCAFSDASGFSAESPFLLQVGLTTETDPLGPDAYGYYIYDQEDFLYNLAPYYEWEEINTVGTALPLNDSGNNQDCVTQATLPFEFTFYGETYNEISVCSNGWIAMGSSEQVTFRNWRIPGPNGPHAMIAAFWDDLRNGTVYTYFNSVDQTFIIEWDDCTNEYNGDEETFQIILYNPITYPTITGDGNIKVNYKTINNVNSQAGNSHGNYCSIGLMDHTGLVGLEYTFNNEYPTQALPISNQSALFFTTDNPLLLDPPIVGVSIVNLAYQASINQILTDQFDISNTGEADLRYNISRTYLTRDAEDYYSWSSSNDVGGPNFSWVDISNNGFDITMDTSDTYSDVLPLGFNFPYWDETYNSIRVCSNGFLSFTSTNAAYENGSIPDDSEPNNIIAPFWDDFSPQLGGSVKFYPDSFNNRFIVTYSDINHFNTNDSVEFQVLLYENGRIDFQYNELQGNSNSATVGIENIDGTEGIQLAYNEAFIEEGLAVSITPNLNWISCSPISGTIAQNMTEQVDITIDTSEMAYGNYACNIEIGSNDPTQPIIVIPVTLQVESNLPPMPPVLQVPLDDIVMNEDTMFSGINLYHNFYDPNFDPLEFSYAGNEHLNIIIVDGELGIMPEPNWSGSETIVITADDLQTNRNTRTAVSDTMIVTVNPVNDAPFVITYEPENNAVIAGDHATVHFLYECFDPDSEIVYTWAVNGNIQGVASDSQTFDLQTGNGDVFQVIVTAADELTTLEQIWFVTIDETGVHDIVAVAKNELYQNSPNPFNPNTSFKFALKEAGYVKLAVYDTRGRKVKTIESDVLSHGIHTYKWDGKDENGRSLGSGVYFYRIESKEFTKTKKALMLK